MSGRSGKERWTHHLSKALDLPRIELGPYASYTLREDPKHLLFELARYKFCAKLLEGKKRVVEVGCGDGFGMPIVAQAVGQVHGIDTDPRVVEDNRRRLTFMKNASFDSWDLVDAPLPHRYDGAYLLDVIEHIDPAAEDAFVGNLCASLEEDAVCVIGTPNREASRFASAASLACHVNLKSAADLTALLGRHFRNGFLFSMNDEVVHTGYHPMAHYFLAAGVGPKRA